MHGACKSLVDVYDSGQAAIMRQATPIDNSSKKSNLQLNPSITHTESSTSSLRVPLSGFPIARRPVLRLRCTINPSDSSLNFSFSLPACKIIVSQQIKFLCSHSKLTMKRLRAQASNLVPSLRHEMSHPLPFLLVVVL